MASFFNVTRRLQALWPCPPHPWARSRSEGGVITVSVIIPAYNASAFIARALDSVLAQTHPIQEIFVVDDGSSDDTRELVEAYGAPVHLLSQGNAGPAAARNLAAAQAHGDVLAFLDADDWWHPEKTAKQLAVFAANPAAVFSYTGLLLVDVNGKQSVHQPVSPDRVASLLRIGNPMIPPSCVMVRSEAFHRLGGFSSIQKGSEDWELWFRLRQLGPFCAVSEPLTNYLITNTGLSANPDHMFRDFEQMLERVLLSDLRGPARSLWRRRIVSNQLFRAAMTARAAHLRPQELRYLLRSIAVWPSPLWQPDRFKSFLVTLFADRSTRGE